MEAFLILKATCDTRDCCRNTRCAGSDELLHHHRLWISGLIQRTKSLAASDVGTRSTFGPRRPDVAMPFGGLRHESEIGRWSLLYPGFLTGSLRCRTLLLRARRPSRPTHPNPDHRGGGAFSNFGIAARSFTHACCERANICRRGTNSLRWRTAPSRML